MKKSLTVILTGAVLFGAGMCASSLSKNLNVSRDKQVMQTWISEEFENRNKFYNNLPKEIKSVFFLSRELPQNYKLGWGKYFSASEKIYDYEREIVNLLRSEDACLLVYCKDASIYDVAGAADAWGDWQGEKGRKFIRAFSFKIKDKLDQKTLDNLLSIGNCFHPERVSTEYIYQKGDRYFILSFTDAVGSKDEIEKMANKYARNRGLKKIYP